jgi:hypothetical protein
MRAMSRFLLWFSLAAVFATGAWAGDLQSPDAVKAGLHKLAAEYGDMDRKLTAERYDRLPHENQEFQEESGLLRAAIAKEPADFRAEVESALAKTLTASGHVADVSATHDKQQVGAALANLATLLKSLNALFPESVRVEPGTVAQGHTGGS